MINQQSKTTVIDSDLVAINVDAGTRFKPHPLAATFPRIGSEEQEKLAADIKHYGLKQPIVLYRDESLGNDLLMLDGICRDDSCIIAGIEPWYVEYVGNDPLALILSFNLHRRHLTREQRRELIEKHLKANPAKSDRLIAGEVNASPTTVSVVRKELVNAGELSNLDTRTGKNGVQQPATKQSRSPAPGENEDDTVPLSGGPPNTPCPAPTGSRFIPVLERLLSYFAHHDDHDPRGLGELLGREQAQDQIGKPALRPITLDDFRGFVEFAREVVAGWEGIGHAN